MSVVARIDLVQVPDTRERVQQEAPVVVEQRSQVDDVLIQFRLSRDRNFLDQTTEVLTTPAMHLRSFDRLAMGGNDATNDSKLIGI